MNRYAQQIRVPSGTQRAHRTRNGTPWCRALGGVLLWAVCFGSPAWALTPFTSDGCSLFPNGTVGQNTLWMACCTAHDMAYWQGGNRAQRRQADRDLETCVGRVADPTLGTLMHAGVRVGGTPYLPTRFRWGYGWPFGRGYRPLTPDEAALAGRELATWVRNLRPPH